MEENTVTETETVEPIVGTEEVVTSVDDMSDAEFAEHFDDVADTDNIDEPEGEVDDIAEDISDDDLYKAQIADTESKLDKEVILKNGSEIYKIDNLNELRNLAERGFNATRKFQKLADDRRVLEEQIASLGAEPAVNSDDDSDAEIEDISTQILNSDYADDFKASFQYFPPEIQQQISTDPEFLKAVRVDIESGLAQKILPSIKRDMAVNGIDFMTSYVNASNKISAQKQHKQEVVQNKKQVLKAEPKQNKYVSQAVDVDSMSDKDFDTYFNNL